MFSEDYPYVLIKFYAYSINQLSRNVWVLGIFVRLTRARPIIHYFHFFYYICNVKISTIVISKLCFQLT